MSPGFVRELSAGLLMPCKATATRAHHEQRGGGAVIGAALSFSLGRRPGSNVGHLTVELVGFEITPATARPSDSVVSRLACWFAWLLCVSRKPLSETKYTRSGEAGGDEAEERATDGNSIAGMTAERLVVGEDPLDLLLGHEGVHERVLQEGRVVVFGGAE